MNIKITRKKVIISALIVMCAAFVAPNISIVHIGGVKTWVEADGGMMIDSAFRLPKNYNGVTPYYTGLDSFGRMWINSVDSHLYYNTGLIRKKIADSPGTGYMTIGGLITGGGAAPAVLYRNTTGQLNVDTLFRYEDGSKIFSLRNATTGDTLLITNGRNDLTAFYINTIIFGKGAAKDTFDFSGVTAGRKVTWQDANGTVAYTSNINSTNVAQCDTTGITVAATLRSYTSSAGGTYLIGGYINITAISGGDALGYFVRWIDENNAIQYAGIGPNPTATGFSASSPIFIRVHSNSIIRVYDSLTTSGGAVTYDAGAVIQLNHP